MGTIKSLYSSFVPVSNLDRSSEILIAATAVLLLFLAATFVSRRVRSQVSFLPFFSQSASDSKTIHFERGGKNPPRTPGSWVPLSFQRPAVEPFPGWDVHTTKPLPYRPFRWGQYHITMGIRSMPWNEWIELDNRFLDLHKMRCKRRADRGELVCRTMPEAYPAALELLEQLVEYLPQRYPSMFKREKSPEGVMVMRNVETGENFDIHARPLPEDPMAMASRMVQDDLAIMLEKPDEQYYFLAGAILQPGFWRMRDKFGQSLATIHSAGRGVPGFKTKLQKGMESFFRRVTPDRPVIRHNYFFQVDDEYAWSAVFGDEDSVSEDAFGWHNVEKNKLIEHHHFRTERQTLVRLPRTGGVVFTIATYFEKVTDIAQEPGVPGRLASAIRGWGSDVSRYKGKDNYAKVLLEYLDMKHQEQLDQGVVVDSEDCNSYPY